MSAVSSPVGFGSASGGDRTAVWRALPMAAMAGIAGCGGDGGTGPPPPAPVATSVAIEPASAAFAWIGDTRRFTATIRDQNGNKLEGAIVWSTGDRSVVSINEGGEATAVSEGTTEIRAAFRGLGASAGVTVEQVAATLEVVSGADQEGLFGTALAEPVVVMVADSGGHAVADEAVVFATDAENGVATPDTAVTHADGLAATTWKLGDRAGPQSLNITVAGPLAATVAATAWGPPLFSVEALVISSLDTTVALPTNEFWGNNWTFDVEETRWLDDYPVASVTRRADPPGLVLEVANPGLLVIKGSVGTTQTVRVPVRPRAPIVYDVRQESWPQFDDVTLRGYALDRIPLPLLEADGEPVLRATGDSAGISLELPPAAEGTCSGDHSSRGALSILGAELRPGANLTLNRLKGPVVDPEVGESVLVEGGDICIRLSARKDAAYVLAAVDRTYINEARHIAEPNRYGGGDLYYWTMVDSSEAVGRDRGGAGPVWVSGRQDPDRVGYGDEIRPWSGPGVPLADGKVASEPLDVGDEFDWSTGDGDYGAFRVMGVYEPNVVLAAFVDDLDEIWHSKSTRQAEMDSLFNYLATPEVQDLYKTIFGPEPPSTNSETGQILVLYESEFSATGRADPNVDGNPRRVVLRLGHAPWGDENGWYTGLMSHEFAHAWQFANYGHFSSNWSSEGIANLFADEETRISAGLPLDANLNVEIPLRLLPLRLPVSGDFSQGYRESHPYLRYLLQRLVGEYGRPYGESIHRVIKGTAEGWHGIHYVRWGQWSNWGRGPGLVGRMREVIPDWDPVESRLDWMIAFALDDRSDFPEYDLPFTRDSWRHFEPWYEFEAGNGADIWGDANLGGNHYYMLVNRRGIPLNIRHRITDGEPNMVWKVFRYR
ncbi:Ig-like domain-containing protein [Candidatus Palauibacter sp.]|uniref:Ig-like domain-containing protein n=1 Tax=Candidatus Palauibacter sp. TaxID=3101350 RepID=UPI003B529503